MSRPLLRFTGLQRTLHWAMALCIIAMLYVGVGMVSTVAPRYVPLLSFHERLGIIVLVLVVLRVIVRARSGAPALPQDLPASLKLAAHLTHCALYALMFLLPLLGWAMLSTANVPIVLGAGMRLPPLLGPSAALHTLLWHAHVYLAFALYVIVLLHVAAALFHAWVRRDGVFATMAPGE